MKQRRLSGLFGILKTNNPSWPVDEIRKEVYRNMTEKEFKLIGAKTSDRCERHRSDLNGRSKRIGERSKRNAPIDSNRLSCPRDYGI